MRQFILSLALLFAVSTVSAKDLNVPDVSTTRGVLNAYDALLVPKDREKIESLTGWIQIGFLWANAALKSRGQSPLYCQPEKLTLTDPQIFDMLRQTIKEEPKLGDYPIGFVELEALRRTFPCNR